MSHGKNRVKQSVHLQFLLGHGIQYSHGISFRMPIARVHSLPARAGKGGTSVEDYYMEGHGPLKGCSIIAWRFLNNLLTNPGRHPGGRGFLLPAHRRIRECSPLESRTG